MSTGQRTKGGQGKTRLRALAKQVLDRSEYVLLRNAWTSFARTKSVGNLCSDLVSIVNCPEKVGLLAEVKLLLPEHVHSEFLQHCRYYQSMALRQKLNGVPHDSKDAQNYKQNPKQNGEKRKRAVIKGRETENRVPNQQVSPVKIAKMKHKTIPSRPKISKHNGKVQSHGKKTCSTDQRSKPKATKDAKCDNTAERTDPKPRKEDCRSVTLERSKDQDFGFRLLGEGPTAGMVVHKVFSNSLADQQEIRVGDRIICVNGFSSNRMPNEEIAKLIKTVKTLHLIILPKRKIKVGKDQASCVTMVTDEASCTDWKEVTVYTDGSGWLGCSIRG